MTRSHQAPFADPLPSLTKGERHRLVQEAYASYEQLFTAVRIARTGKGNATALGGISGKTTGTVMMCTTTYITGTLDEVAALYTAQDSHFVLDFAQSTRLYELESPSRDHPMRCVGLRYSRWASISSLVSDRDLLYLETMDEFIDRKTGHRGWARCTKSIAHRSCPPSQHPNGPIRAELFVMGMVARETSTIGVLELITLVHANVKNTIPSWITRTVLKRRKKTATSLSHVIKIRRRIRDGGSGGGSQVGDLIAQINASEDEIKDKRACKGCMDHVSRWTRSYKCRKCNELICKSCAAMTYFDTDTQEVRNRICVDCSFGSMEDEGHSTDGDVERGYFDQEREIRGEREKQKKKNKNEDADADHRHRTFSYLSVDSQPYGSTSVCDDSEVEDLGSTMHRLDQLNVSSQNEEEGKENRKLQRHGSNSSNRASNPPPPQIPDRPAARAYTPRSRPASRQGKLEAAPPAAAPMIDLSYLQTFAAPKASKAEPKEEVFGQLV